MTRFFDILFSVLGLIVLSPLMLAVYIIIVTETRGEGLYCQERTGRHGKPFRLIKFRSMYTGADRQGLITVGGHDNRITRTGYFIRKYKIDELPQLFNVIKGDMSLVGPRPEVRKYTDMYTDEQRKVLSVRPGITDYASIKYVDENEILGASSNPEQIYTEVIMPDKIRLNMVYINRHGVKEYFKIIFLTLANIAR